MTIISFLSNPWIQTTFIASTLIANYYTKEGALTTSIGYGILLILYIHGIVKKKEEPIILEPTKGQWEE